MLSLTVKKMPEIPRARTQVGILVLLAASALGTTTSGQAQTPEWCAGIDGFGAEPGKPPCAQRVIKPVTRAQPSPNTEKLAADAAELVAKANVRRVLTAPLEGCLLEMQVCTTLDAALRNNIKRVIPGTEWVTHEKVASSLRNHGLLPLDAYSGLALRVVASEAGAELLVTEDLRRNIQYALELVMQVFDAAHGKELGEFKVNFSLADADDRPMVFTDPEGGASLVINRGNPQWPKFVRCLMCVMPVYLPARVDTAIRGLVDVLVTVTERGTVDQIVVVKTPDDGITSELLKKIQGWRLKPAEDREGKPFAVRTHIQVEVVLYPFK